MLQVSTFHKILFQFVLFYDTLTVYAENKRKRQNLQILVFTGVGLTSGNNLQTRQLFHIIFYFCSGLSLYYMYIRNIFDI